MMLKIWSILIFVLSLLEYSNAQSRVVNGWDVDPPFKFPWVVRIAFNQYPYPGQYCGGTLLTPEWILTAAHCSMESASRFTVEVHRHDLNRTVQQEDTQTRSVSEIHRHPDYGRFNGNNNDIAVWKLSEPINMVDGVDTVVLDAGEFAHFDNEVSVIGWGTLEDSRFAPLPDVLQQANVFIVNCLTSAYVTKMRYSFDPSEMCAGFTDNLGVTYDSCSGDSGGPLFDLETEVQSGVISFGISCALPDYPGVYSHVGERDNRNFITSKVPDTRWSDEGDGGDSDGNEDESDRDESDEDEQTEDVPDAGGEEMPEGLCPVALDGRTGPNAIINGVYNFEGFSNTRPYYQNPESELYLFFAQNMWVVSSVLGGDTAFAYITSGALSGHEITGVWQIASNFGTGVDDAAVKAQCDIPDCGAEPLAWISDGYCDSDFHNTEECLWDGGDCCNDSCDDSLYLCGSNGYQCLDPQNNDPDDAGTCDILVRNRIGDHAEINGLYTKSQETFEGRSVYYNSDTELYLASGPRNFWWIGYTLGSVGTSVAMNRDADAEEPYEATEYWRVRNIRGWETDSIVRVDCDNNLRLNDGDVEECDVIHEEWLGDGWCDYTYPDYNSAVCNFDGGDCCETTCEDNVFECGVYEYYCVDPNAPEPDSCQPKSGFVDGDTIESPLVDDTNFSAGDCCTLCKETDGCVAWNLKGTGLCQLKSTFNSIVDDVTGHWQYGDFNVLPPPDEFCVYEIISSDVSCPFAPLDIICIDVPRHDTHCPSQEFMFISLIEGDQKIPVDTSECLYRWTLQPPDIDDEAMTQSTVGCPANAVNLQFGFDVARNSGGKI